MQFNSYEFIVIFMPLLFAGYFLLSRLSHLWGKLFLIGMGGYFYVYFGFASVPVLLVSLLVNYAAACMIGGKKAPAKLIVALAIVLNIALLFYFKYFGFLLDNVNMLLGSQFHVDIFLPLGISFYTFQQISYVLHVYRSGENKGIVDYLLYILYFPKLIMGPLAEPDELICQFNDERRKRIDWENIACGLKLFSFGLFKKAVIADTFALAVSWLFANLETAGSADVFLCMLAYTFEIYFDFSGYSDMAVGISQMLNIDLPINFNSPYKALSVRDFWNRWHMSLTDFFRRNLYFPLGGRRRGDHRMYLNIMIVFLVSGIWHGANWTFIVWGILHGALSVAERIFEKYESRVNEVFRWVTTFLCVSLLWLLFRADSLFQWLDMVKTMIQFESTAVSPELLKCFEIPELATLIPVLHLSWIKGLAALLFYLAAFVICLLPENNYRSKQRLTLSNSALAVLAFFFGFINLGGESVFVYFNF